MFATPPEPRLSPRPQHAALPCQTVHVSFADVQAITPDAAGVGMDIVFVEGFRSETVIGIHHGEDQPQPLVIDLQAGVPRLRACDTDDIADTIDYSVVRSRLLRLMAEHKLKMLEAFAEAVANIMLLEFGARWVRVKVVKPHKFPDVQSFGVQIERHAPQPLPEPAGRSAAVLQLLGSGMVPGGK